MNKEYLRKLFNYDPATGQLTWRISRGSRAKVGSVAGYKEDGRYVNIRLDGKIVYAHRLVWAWHGFELPEIIDHINCDKHDNRIENLRAADPSESQCNHRIRGDSKSGVKGVSWNANKKKWQARIQFRRRHRWIGLFDSIDDAAKEVNRIRLELHGEFARLQ